MITPTSPAEAAPGRVGRWLQELSAGELDGRERVLFVAVIEVLVVLIGVIDATTGPELPMSVLYVLPVAVTAVAIGTTWSIGMSVECLLIWVFVGRWVRGPREPVFLVSNIVLRAAAFAGVIVLLRTLQRALVATARSQRTTEEFLANAAHQLRTPLAGVMATAEALATEDDPEMRERLTLHLTNSTERVGDLLRSLLQFASLSAGAPRVVDTFDLVEAVQRELDHAEIRYPEIRFELRVDGPVAALADRRAVTEAVANVLDNAGRHAAAAVQVTVGTVGTSVDVAVHDDGPGVPAGMEDAIFERFVSGERTGGAGLGLAIARGLLDREGGGVEHRDGSFHLWVPAARSGRAGRSAPRVERDVGVQAASS